MLNRHFNQFYDSSEQSLLNDLTVESIQIYGHDVYYLPRKKVDRDYLFGEDRKIIMDTAIPIEVYVENVDGFMGQKEVLTKIGLQVTDTATLLVSITRFKNEVKGQPCPREGDLIYLPMSNGIFEINYVEDEAHFYNLGQLYVYRFTIELFSSDYQTFDTGVSAIDRLSTDQSNQVLYNKSDSTKIEQEIKEILIDDAREENSFVTVEDPDDFDEANPFGQY